MTKIVYVGPYIRGEVPDIGVFERNKVVDVPAAVANELLKSPQFKLAPKRKVKPDES